MVLPTSNQTIRYSDIQTEFGGTNPIFASEYYGNGTYVSSSVPGIPLSGTLQLSQFNGKDKFAGIIDNITSTGRGNAVALYSFKLVLKSYSGPIVRVRNGSDNSLSDFYASTIGTLGTGALGTGTTLSSWLNGASGYVHTWYDQSGRAKHLTQTTNALQPTIGQSGAETYAYLNNDQSLSGPNAFDTSTVSDAHIIFQSREISRVQNFLVSLNGTNTTNRFTVHAPWTNGVWYFDPYDAGTNRAVSVANATSVNAKVTFSGYKSSTDTKNGFRLNGGTRYLSATSSSVPVSGGVNLNIYLAANTLCNHYLYSLLIFSSKLDTNDETYLESNV
jgi:hypothetical protein